MKRIKRIAGLLLAMVMTMAMTATAFAAGSNTITVTGAKEGETYKIYKMLDLTVHENEDSEDETDAYDGFNYTLNEKWSGFWTTGAGKDYIETNTVGSKTYVVWKDGMDSAAAMETLGKAAAAWAADNSITADAADITVAEGAETAEFTALDNGYYMITSTYGTAVTIGSTPNNADQTIQEKNNENTTDKDVLEAEERNGEQESWGDANDAAVGDTVTFRSKVSIAKNSINVVYHDTMDDGLTFQGAVNVKVYTDEACTTELAAENYEVVTQGIGTETFQVKFTNDYVATLTAASTDLYIKYTAVLNDNAVVVNPENNTAKITWGDHGESEESTTKTSTHKFEILKYDGTDTEKNPLAGAKFQLFTQQTEGTALSLAVSADGKTYRVVNSEDELPTGYTMTMDNKIVTLDSGNITVEGVDSDDYYLEETDAPLGYNKLTERVKVQVDAQNNVVSEIENLSGSVLPSTGGIGTTIFYVVGAVLAIGAGILLVTKKRMSVR